MSRAEHFGAALLSLLGSIPLALGLVATYVMAFGGGSWARLPFRLICHGLEERCLSVWNQPMPVCARCVGIYVGLIVAAILWAAIGGLQGLVMHGSISLLLASPLVIDGLTQALGLRESTNALRLATGFLAAVSFGVYVLSHAQREAGVLAVETHSSVEGVSP